MLWGKHMRYCQKISRSKYVLKRTKNRVYVDSSPDAFDDPKVETIVELITRIWVSPSNTLPPNHPPNALLSWCRRRSGMYHRTDIDSQLT
jgi:hypothetical protein